MDTAFIFVFLFWVVVLIVKGLFRQRVPPREKEAVWRREEPARPKEERVSVSLQESIPSFSTPIPPEIPEMVGAERQDYSVRLAKKKRCQAVLRARIIGYETLSPPVSLR